MPLLRLVVVLLLGLAGTASAQQEPVVRVRLFGGPSLGTARLSPTDAPLTIRMDGAAVATVPVGATVSVDRSSDGRVNVEGDGINERGVVLEIEAAPGSATRLQGGRIDRRYRGTLRITQASSARILVVNAVGLSDYVASVTAHEYPFPEIEGVKAQAVLARTYALHRASPARDYDLDDHQGSQVYLGVGAETAVSREATRATAGQVLRYGDRLIEAVYSSSSGGHTADNETVWGTAPVAYLRGRPDPYDAEAPDHTWRVAVDAGRLFSALSARWSGVTGISVAERSREGRALRVTLHGDAPRTISATDFRAVVNARLGGRTLRSTHFAISMEGDQVVFTGRGFGHGVGMSQYGARGQARAGRSYTDILAFYFAGVTLDVLPHGTAPAPTLPTTPASEPLLADASPGVGTRGAALPRAPGPVVRGTWGPRRTSPTSRAEARAEVIADVQRVLVVVPPSDASSDAAPAAPAPAPVEAPVMVEVPRPSASVANLPPPIPTAARTAPRPRTMPAFSIPGATAPDLMMDGDAPTFRRRVAW